MNSIRRSLALSLALALPSPAQEPVEVEESFPQSTAMAEGVSPEALDELDDLVQSLVDDGDIVGAELLVIKNGRSILHEAYGWGDQEARAPMEIGSAFCVRSMTKPVVGTAILMLIDEKVLAFGDRVSKYLPAFDAEGTREITVEQLLSHTSGLPMSLILGKDPRELTSLREVADLGGGQELAFAPGSDFLYSDQGTDTLTALIEVVSGMPAEEFVRSRVLEPLGMRNSACVLTEDHPLRERALPAYSGSRGTWTRFWGPDEPPLFPIFLGSQGLYATLEDYARFLELWRRKGRGPSERLLGARYLRQALRPSPFELGASTGFPGLVARYGLLMTLWTGESADGEREVVAFGHNGSDGTHAWVFPEQRGMVLYFTQSRETPTGLRVEEALGELFLGVPFDPNQAAPPLEPYLGLYWEGENDLYRAIVRDGEDLALEILGKGAVRLRYAGDDRWKLPDPSLVLAFDRSETGEVTGYHIGEHQEIRFEPAADLPSVEEVAAQVRAAHRLDLLETLGPLRTRGEVAIDALGMKGELETLYAWPDRFRIETSMSDQLERVTHDGERVALVSPTAPAAVLEGPRAASLRQANLFARFGDWADWYPELCVIQRLERDGRTAYVVRAGDTSAPGTTLYVDAESGRVVQADGLTHVDGQGRVGQRTSFSDFREVSGVLLPFRTELELAIPYIGTIVVTTSEVELGVELEEGAFAMPE